MWKSVDMYMSSQLQDQKSNFVDFEVRCVTFGILAKFASVFKLRIKGYHNNLRTYTTVLHVVQDHQVEKRLFWIFVKS